VFTGLVDQPCSRVVRGPEPVNTARTRVVFTDRKMYKFSRNDIHEPDHYQC